MVHELRINEPNSDRWRSEFGLTNTLSLFYRCFYFKLRFCLSINNKSSFLLCSVFPPFLSETCSKTVTNTDQVAHSGSDLKHLPPPPTVEDSPLLHPPSKNTQSPLRALQRDRRSLNNEVQPLTPLQGWKTTKVFFFNYAPAAFSPLQ